jgi:tetratricopeptide (TPR) repeat protein
MRRGNIEKSATAVIPVPRAQLEQASDLILLASAQVKSRMGRFAEGESDMRRALLNRLKATGKYHPQTARYIAAFGSLLIEQGRFEEARKLLITAIDIYRQLGIPEDSQVLVLTNAALASVLALEGHWKEASETNAAIERAMKDWEPARRENVILTHSSIDTLFKSGKPDVSLAAARRLLELKQARYGDHHPDTNLARGHYAVALARTGKDATHGLVPGELDGLDQPALALSAPDVAGVEGDGLLTMQEILSLKLDADWVVLSACNTGAGAGAGAEAASGLGRALFYAGTRAILVTNWSVHSQSARELVTDLFRHEAGSAKLTRGEALQQAMMALMDGKGYTDDKG